VVNYHRRDLPLDAPAELLERILAQPGQKPPLAKLQSVVLGLENAPSAPPRAINGSNGNGHRLPEPPAVDLSDGKSATRRMIDWLEVEISRTQGDYEGETRSADRFLKGKLLQAIIGSHHRLLKASRSVEIDSENSLNRAECKATWSRFAGAANARLRELPQRVAAHPMFRGIDSEAVEQLLVEEMAELLRGLPEQCFGESEG
jgi:hypothetical protein